ncbi:hypothetical protein C8R44DRAFT_44130 [Mycena epipterygia]|nr:hypothetical protein C8R44DRAFT_44130 [Mycena epipterygia]
MSDFSSNAPLPKPPVTKPHIWAHLFALDKWMKFCGTTPAALAHATPATYLFASEVPALSESLQEETEYTRFKGAADAIALMCAVSKDAESVTAYSIEIAMDAQSQESFTVRLARNGKFPPQDIGYIVQFIAEANEKIEQVEWINIQSSERAKLMKVIALVDMLPRIGERCRSKITDTVNGKGGEALVAWAAIPRDLSGFVISESSCMLSIRKKIDGIISGRLRNFIISAHTLLFAFRQARQRGQATTQSCTIRHSLVKPGFVFGGAQNEGHSRIHSCGHPRSNRRH